MTEKSRKHLKEAAGKTLVQPQFHCEIDGDAAHTSIILSGINSIRDFSDNTVLLRTRGFFVKITGKALSLAVYENKTLEISGKIFAMELIYDKN